MKLSAEGSEFFFYYSLLGNDITSEPFHNLLSPDFEPERASVRIRSSKQILQTFLSQQPGLEVRVKVADRYLTTTCYWPCITIIRPRLSLLLRSTCAVGITLWAAQTFLSPLCPLFLWIWRTRRRRWRERSYSNLQNASNRHCQICLLTCSRT